MAAVIAVDNLPGHARPLPCRHRLGVPFDFLAEESGQAHQRLLVSVADHDRMHPEAGAQLIEGLVFAQRHGDHFGLELNTVPFPRPFAGLCHPTWGCLSQLDHWSDSGELYRGIKGA